MNPSLVVMRGAADFDIQRLSDIEAGVAFLALADQVMPGITWDRLLSMGERERLSGWWTDFKQAAGNVKDGIGDIMSDTIGVVGRVGGDAIRLATDDKVIDGASRIGTAYATSGGSEGLRGLLTNIGASGETTDQVMDFLSTLGSVFKGSSAGAAGASQSDIFGIPAKVWPIVLISGVGLYFVTRPRQ